jgi:hypothetical protein
MKKWTNELIRVFSKEEVQMAQKHMKKCFSSLTKYWQILPWKYRNIAISQKLLHSITHQKQITAGKI